MSSEMSLEEANAEAVPATGANVGNAVTLGDGTNKVKTAMSNLLTVWRSLYLEVDSMSVKGDFGRGNPLIKAREEVAHAALSA